MPFSSVLNSDHQNSNHQEEHDSHAVIQSSDASATIAQLNDCSTMTSAQISQRLQIHCLQASSTISPDPQDDADVVIQGLGDRPKTLPPRFFYDDYGSQLFEQICQLPEYYLTRAETQIFQTCADQIAQITGACELVELGSGSSTKTRIILDAYQQAELPLRYVPIDISEGILRESAHQLLTDYDTLKIYGIVGTYQQALKTLMPSTLPKRLIAFIGSTLGNLPPAQCNQFLSQIADALTPGDYFLLGIDLQKDPSILEAAYNDSQGITAAFNLNMLNHLNRKFSGDFDENQFEHVAFYNTDLHQIEMHLRSKVEQAVHLKTLNFNVHFDEGETIHSEVSRKFNLQEIAAQLRSHGLDTVEVWTDPQQWFGVILAKRHSLEYPSNS
ncbi:MAG: L-histidine N(alpha)-methyltransferase [Cyanobacteria bacterium P01_E01_bin.6]